MVDREQKNIASYREQLSSIETQLEKAKDQLRNYQDQEVRDIQKEIDILEARIASSNIEQGYNLNQIEILTKKIEALNKQIRQQKAKLEKQETAKKRAEITLDSINCLIEVRKRLEN